MEGVVPRSKPSPYTKRWWTKDLEKARREARRAASATRTYRNFPLHSSHREAKAARNRYNELINKSKQEHWESWLEGISSKSVWDTHKFTAAPASDGSKARIPALINKDAHGQPVETLDNEGKSKLLHKVFFYQPPADAGVDPNQRYPEPVFGFEEITNEQIE